MHRTSFFRLGLLPIYLVCLFLNFFWFKEVIFFEHTPPLISKSLPEHSSNYSLKKGDSSAYLISYAKMPERFPSYHKKSQQAESEEAFKLAKEQYEKGKRYQLVGKLDSAKYYIYSAFSKSKDFKFKYFSTLNWIIDLGIIYQEQDSILSSIECYTKSIEIIEKIPTCKVSTFLQNYHQPYLNLAEIYSNLGLKQEAQFYSNRALVKSDEIGLAKPIVQSIISVINQKPTINGTKLHFDRGYHISQYLDDPMLRYQLLRTMSQICIDSSELKLARKSITENYDLAKKLKNKDALNWIKLQQASLLYIDKSFVESFKLAKELQEYYEANHNNKFLELIYHNLSLNFESKGQIDSSLYFANKASYHSNLLKNDQYILSTISRYLASKDKQRSILKKLEQQNLENLAFKAKVKAKRSYYISILSVIFSTILLISFGYIYLQKNWYTLRLKILNKDLQNEEKKLNSTNKKLKNFTNVISHDILSNLYIVLSASNIFKDTKDRENNLEQYFNITQQTSIELTEYCGNLLKETQSTSFHNSIRVDPNPILEKVLNRFKSILVKHNFNIEKSALSNTHLSVATLEQLFQNLISNSIRYASSPSMPKIKITEKINDSNYLEWHFKDNGPGIRDSVAKQLFLLKKKDIKVNGSQQMGLALLKESLNNQGANILLSNHHEQGAHFIIQIPYH